MNTNEYVTSLSEHNFITTFAVYHKKKNEYVVEMG